MAALYKTRRFITSGTKTSVTQAFYNNDFINPEEAQVPYYSMVIPTIVVTAGTKDYYGQDPLSIVTNSGKPVLRVQFLSGGTNVSPSGVGITQVRLVIPVCNPLVAIPESDAIEVYPDGDKVAFLNDIPEVYADLTLKDRSS